MELWTHICHPERLCTLLLLTSPKPLILLLETIFGTNSYNWGSVAKCSAWSGPFMKMSKPRYFQGNESEEFECSLGVRQGDCLSPFLCAMYINDLEQILIDNHCGIDFGQYKMALLLYADDVILLSDSSTKLQNALDVTQNYSNRWKLKINVIKSKILVFKKGRRRAN